MENPIEAVKQFANDAEAAIKHEVAKLTADEQLVIRSIEAEYLRIQVDLQNLAKRSEDAAKRYKDTVEGYAKRYTVDLAVHAWDAVKLEFKRLENSL